METKGEKRIKNRLIWMIGLDLASVFDDSGGILARKGGAKRNRL